MCVGLTLAEATELRTAWKAALLAISTGQSYTIGSRSLTRADLAEAERLFNKYDQLVDALTAGRSPGAPIFRVVPRDT